MTTAHSPRFTPAASVTMLLLTACVATEAFAGPRVYVAARDRFGDETLATLDPVSNTIVQNVTLPTGDRVYDLAGGQQSHEIYVSRGNRIDVYDTWSHTVPAGIFVPDGLTAVSLVMSPGGDRVYALAGDYPVVSVGGTAPRLHAIDTQTKQIVQSLLVAENAFSANGLTISPDGAVVYADVGMAYFGSGTVHAIETSNLTVIDTLFSGYPAYAFIEFDAQCDTLTANPHGSPVLYRLWAELNFYNGTSTYIDLLDTASDGCEPNVHPLGHQLYVLGFEEDAYTVAVVDTAILAKVDSIGLGIPWDVDQWPQMTMLPDGNRLYVTSPAEDRIRVIDTVARSIVDDVLIESPTEIVIGGALPPFGASLEAIHSVVAWCYNDSTGQMVEVHQGDEEATAQRYDFDCEAAGLRVEPGHQLRITLEAVREAEDAAEGRDDRR